MIKMFRLVACFFQPRIDRRDRVGGIGAEKAHDVRFGIAGDHRVEHVPPAVGTVDVAIAQGAGRSVPASRTG